MTRRWPAALALIVTLCAAGCGGDAPSPAPTPPPPDLDGPPPAIAVNPGPYDAGPISVPASGAYLGAWVKPEVISQPGRLTAIRGLETGLGRDLDIVHTYRKWDEKFGTESDLEFMDAGATLLFSWASGDTRSITSGEHDELIRAQARRIAKAKRPVLMRFRWEMDRPNLRPSMWSGEDYVAAWRHVRRIFDAERAWNASWVWCPTSEGFENGEAPAFYPGDDAVDWTCVDVYAGESFRSLGDLLTPFLHWAAQRPKPILIGEYGVAAAWGSERRAAWLRDATRLFKANPQIKGVCYFDSDPDGNPPEKQFQISGDVPAFAAFTELTRDPWFNQPTGPRRARPKP
ncbi:hypothetical protein J2S43_007792 [Catenuloplanes nepalensis]|uniref:GH26 domain-containing protein n=1 Tax=Catenuloplanes nepalensis TaxID=587533 RepID=A0ABT9N6F8_9ACTN|nr:endoglucanase [Catenuloplanes nepalensis]MDP9799280.1 hypothetical protein [Catenuloplanes nepalensis]